MQDAAGNVFVFQYTEGQRNAPVPVVMNGKRVGTIKPCDGGWRYVPNGAKRAAGDVMKTVAEVQRSLIGA